MLTSFSSLTLWICIAAAWDVDERVTDGRVGNSSLEDELGTPDAAAHAIDTGHLLPEHVQRMLPGLFSKYGVEAQIHDQDTNYFLHQLLPNASFDEIDVTATDNLESPGDPFPAIVPFVLPQSFNPETLRQEGQTPSVQLGGDTKGIKALETETDGHDARKAAEEERRKHKEKMQAIQNSHDDFMKRNHERQEKARARREATKERHAMMSEHMTQLLQQVHEQVERDTHGFQDAPFWDDFFRSSSARERWGLLNLDGLKPALEAAALQPGHRVLVIEPSVELGLAERMAGALKNHMQISVASHAYGAEPEEQFDMILELGLLDAMAIGGRDGSVPRLSQLQNAASRFATLLRPGGAWLSISSVPPSLRTPLLARLGRASFSELPSVVEHIEVEGDPGATGTHTVMLQPAASLGQKKDEQTQRLRGASASLLGSQDVANILLYGGREPRAFSYRLRRGEENWEAQKTEDESPEDLEGLLAAQQKSLRDDL